MAGKRNQDKTDTVEQTEQTDIVEQLEQTGAVEQAKPIEQTEQTEPTEPTEPTEQIEQSEQTDTVEQVEQPEKPKTTNQKAGKEKPTKGNKITTDTVNSVSKIPEFVKVRVIHGYDLFHPYSNKCVTTELQEFPCDSWVLAQLRAGFVEMYTVTNERLLWTNGKLVYEK